MKTKILILTALATTLVGCSTSSTELAVNNNSPEMEIYPTEGFMNGGWGNIKFKFAPVAKLGLKVVELVGEWRVDTVTYHRWDTKPSLELSQKDSVEHTMTTWMPDKSQELVAKYGKEPQVEGYALLSDSSIVNFTVEIPVATLPSPIVSKGGKYISVQLQQTTWDRVKNPEKVVNYLDKAYECMMDLTGNTPFEGEVIGFLEAPRNPYFAYAGNPIIFNTSFVESSIARFDNDVIDYGWIHELGHDFDNEIGNCYNWGTFTEFQANIKLSYVVEMMCKDDTKCRIESWVDKPQPRTGVAFNDEYFPPYGEKYLASDRTGESMKSDEYHAMFFTVIRKEGWDVMKKFYRCFKKMCAEKRQPANEERVAVALSVFDYCSAQDLAPLYKQYRIDLDREKMDALMKKYYL